MNKTMKLLAVVSVLSLGLVLPSSYALEPMVEYSFPAYETIKLVGTQVKGPEGKTLGSIGDLVIDAKGRVAFVALQLNSGKFIAVPFDTLSISYEKRDEINVVLNIEKGELESAPRFDGKAALMDYKWATDVYRYFGQQPYWEEGKGEGSKTMTLDDWTHWGGY